MAQKTRNRTPISNDELHRRIADLENSSKLDGGNDPLDELSEYEYDGEEEGDEEYSRINWEKYDEDENPVDEFYTQKFQEAKIKARRKKNKDEDDEGNNLEDLYSTSLDGSKKGRGFFDRLKNAFLRGGPTTSVAAAIVGVFGLGSIWLGPASLLVNLHEVTTNHLDFGNYIHKTMGNSYIGALFAGANRPCDTSKIKCTLTRMSDKQKERLEKRGIRVVADRSTFLPGFWKVRAFEFPNNTRVDSRNAYRNLKYNDLESFKLTRRFPVTTAFLNPGAALNDVMKKFGKNLADRWRSSKNPDRDQRDEENRRAYNEQAKADPDRESSRRKLRAQGESERNKIASSTKARLTSLKNNLKSGPNAIAWAGLAACMMYDVIRTARAAVILMWHQKLIDFGLEFIKAGSAIKDGSFDWEDAEFFGDWLTRPVTKEDVQKYPDLYDESMIGQTAMDSKAFAAALSGDHQKIEGTWAEKYTSWAPVDKVFGADVVKWIEDAVTHVPGIDSGKEGIKYACHTITYLALGSAAACFRNIISGAVCGFAVVIENALFRLFGDYVLRAITDKFMEPAMDAIADADLSTNLHGPPLGEAIVGMAGTMGGYMDRASGFTVAGTPDEAKQAYLDMITDETYIAQKKYEASKNQFDLTNEYSFASQFVSRFASTPWNGTLFSIFANIGNILSPKTIMGDTVSAQAVDGLYQPIAVLSSIDKIEGAMRNCQDPGLSAGVGIDIPGLGESCHPIPVILSPVKECLEAEAAGEDRICIHEAIDYLSEKCKYRDDEDEVKPCIDGDTGKPSDWNQFSKSGEEKNYKNPFLMFMQYCGAWRKYPPGYTDKPIGSTVLEEFELTDLINVNPNPFDPSSAKKIMEMIDFYAKPADDWHDYTNCAKYSNKEALAWMSFYYVQCITIYASEEDLEFCWDDPKTGKNVSTGGAWVLPVEGPCTSPYGPRWGSMHQGIDIAPPEGTPIVAPTDMKILKVVKGGYGGGYGTHVIAQATDGSGKGFLFGHMIEGSNSHLNEGDEVAGGTEIGKVGNTGHSFGAHLHFNIYPEGVNPLLYSGEEDPVPVLAEKGLSVSCG